jgi:hypothetical protein
LLVRMSKNDEARLKIIVLSIDNTNVLRGGNGHGCGNRYRGSD